MDAGVAYFGGDNGSGTGIELWRTEGSVVTTQLVKDIYPGATTSSPGFFGNIGGTLLFQAEDGVNGLELWMSDGTEVGTVMVEDIYPGATGSEPRYMTSANGRLFFSATDGVNGRELWTVCPDAVLDKAIIDFGYHDPCTRSENSSTYLLAACVSLPQPLRAIQALKATLPRGADFPLLRW